MKLVIVLALLCYVVLGAVMATPLPQTNLKTRSIFESRQASAAPAPVASVDDDDDDDDDVDLDITGDDDDDDEEEEDDDDDDYLERFIDEVLGGKIFFSSKFLIGLIIENSIIKLMLKLIK
jgi:hypothetical protein